MSEHKTLGAALVAASAELKNPKMDASNPHFRSKFASLLSCEAAVRPVLAEHGLALVQRLGGEAGLVTVETVIMHTNGEVYSCGVAATSPDKQGPQAYGSAVTYLRRYGLLAALGLVGDPDDDAEAATDHGGSQKPVRSNADIDQQIIKAAEARWQSDEMKTWGPLLMRFNSENDLPEKVSKMDAAQKAMCLAMLKADA
ncbi:MAG: ERF family protein [bacterium]|nr:ERF family protein [bacterium]